MSRTSLAYRLLVRAAVGAIPLAAPFHAKLARSHQRRRGALERLTAWARAQRDPRRPLVWMHAPSVGEGLQARAVLQRLQARRPDWQIAYTYFSPSAEEFARGQPADISEYLPYDTPEAAREALDLLQPSALVFAKLDVWPELATSAAERGIPAGLIAGTVSPVSGRVGWPSRLLIRPGYAALSAVGAIADSDAERLIGLGVAPHRIQVTGDPRYDSVLDVISNVSPDDPLVALGRAAPTLVAGSTWPADESVVLEAFAAVRSTHPEARLMLVPHEPTPDHLARTETLAGRVGLRAPVRLGPNPAPDSWILVDRTGVLARLYGAGTMAYVGGGFGRAGLHSVLEPAAWGLPVVFGPEWRNSREAAVLQQAGAGCSLPRGSTAAAARLAGIWRAWLSNEAARGEAGERARKVVRDGAGAAERSAALVEQLVVGFPGPVPTDR
ncbi:MAG TPA: glycosyltransferase N-terminal domain-containing protein [Gemmatimonadales bacterium]